MNSRRPIKSIKNMVNHKLQSHVDDDEETLSLRDLSITTTSPSNSPITLDLHHTKTNPSRPSSSSSSDSSFEFLTNTTDATASTADDVIIDGHILPYTPPPLLPRRSLSLFSTLTRSESNSDSAATRSSSAVMRLSRSLNCQKLHRKGAKIEEASLLYSRSSSTSSRCRNNNNNNNNNNNEIIKLPWYNWLILGLPMKIPAEIELKDIKQRQSRRNIPPSIIFPGDRRGSSSSVSWKVLSILSCKSHSSIDVINTPPIFP